MALQDTDLLAIYRESTSTNHKLTIDKLKSFVGDSFEVPSDINPPSDAEPGDLWFNETDGRLYYYYDDGNSQQWVDANPASSGGGGASVEVSDTEPANPSEGDLWWDSSTDSGQLYIYYVDANSSQWVEASPSSGGGDASDLQAVTDAGNTTTNGATFGGGSIELAADGSANFANNGVNIDNSGSVGIGTTSIGHKLVVNQQNIGGIAAIHLPRDASTILGPFSTTLIEMGGNMAIGAAGAVTFSIAGAEKARLASSGHLLIGGSLPDESAPNITLEAGGNITTSGRFQADRDHLGGTYRSALNGVVKHITYSDGTTKIGSTGDAQNTPNITLNGDGRVLIGTYETPSKGNGQYSTLALQGYANTPQGAGHLSLQRGQEGFGVDNQIGHINFGDSKGASYAGIDCYSDADSGPTNYPGRLMFSTTAVGEPLPTERMRISSDGITTFAKTVFAGDSANVGTGLFAATNNASAATPAITARNYNAGNGGLLVGYNSVGAINVTILADGSATFNGTVTATVVPPSDARFKENITPAKPQLADVVALGGILKNYDWTDEAPLNEELRSVRQLGLVAQEVEDICPSLVKDINRTKTVEVKPAVVGPKGKVIKEAVTEQVDDSYKGLSQDALIMKLIGAVAELSALETKVAELSAEVEALKTT